MEIGRVIAKAILDGFEAQRVQSSMDSRYLRYHDGYDEADQIAGHDAERIIVLLPEMELGDDCSGHIMIILDGKHGGEILKYSQTELARRQFFTEVNILLGREEDELREV